MLSKAAADSNHAALLPPKALRDVITAVMRMSDIQNSADTARHSTTATSSMCTIPNLKRSLRCGLSCKTPQAVQPRHTGQRHQVSAHKAVRSRCKACLLCCRQAVLHSSSEHPGDTHYLRLGARNFTDMCTVCTDDKPGWVPWMRPSRIS